MSKFGSFCLYSTRSEVIAYDIMTDYIEIVSSRVLYVVAYYFLNLRFPVYSAMIFIRFVYPGLSFNFYEKLNKKVQSNLFFFFTLFVVSAEIVFPCKPKCLVCWLSFDEFSSFIGIILLLIFMRVLRLEKFIRVTLKECIAFLFSPLIVFVCFREIIEGSEGKTTCACHNVNYYFCPLTDDPSSSLLFDKTHHRWVTSCFRTKIAGSSCEIEKHMRMLVPTAWKTMCCWLNLHQ